MQTLVIGLVEVEWFVDGRAMHGCMISENRSVVIIELRSLKLWKEKQEIKEKWKKRLEEISQDEREKTREEERRKIMKEMKR